MGQKLSILEFNQSCQIVMIGLDNAGKSTTLYRLKLGHYVATVPTIGFNCERIKPSSGHSKGIQFLIWDVGGQDKLRPLWRAYVRHTDAVVFIVDSTDNDRFEEAKTELSNLLRTPDMPHNVPILLLANKQDLAEAQSEHRVKADVGFYDLEPAHPSHCLPCCAVTGEGLDDMFDIIYQLIQRSRKLKQKRNGH